MSDKTQTPTVDSLIEELLTVDVDLTDDRDIAEILFKQRYSTLARLQKRPIARTTFERMDIPAAIVDDLVDAFGPKDEPAQPVMPTIPTEITLRPAPESIPWNEKPLADHLSHLVANPDDKIAMDALGQRDDIRKAQSVAGAYWVSAKKTGDKYTLNQEETIWYVRQLNNPRANSLTRLPSGNKPVSIGKALGAVDKFMMHPMRRGKVLMDGFDGFVVWTGQEGWDNDYLEAIFWASGLHNGRRHELWNMSWNEFDVHGKLSSKDAAMMRIVQDYRESDDNGKIEMVVTTVEGEQRPPFGDSLYDDEHGRHGGRVQFLKENIVTFKNQIGQSFDLAELRDLCFETGIPYEDLGGQGKSEKILAFVQYVDRHGSVVPKLYEALNKKRPHTNWKLFFRVS